MKEDTKIKVLHSLVVCYGKGMTLEDILDLRGDEEDRKKVAEANNKLKVRIDELRRCLHNQWQGTAEKLSFEMRHRNTSLQSRIKDIRKKVKVAENVVKAVGHIDDAAKFAVSIIA